ncbi:flagellar associated protein, partial [Haematococcus lacustris]
RHNWEAIIGEAFDFPAYSAKALAAAAKAGLMAMMDPATMTKKMFMLAMQAFKYLLDKLIESLRRPIAHYDPALRCVHVLVRAYAPIKPGESQGAVVVRDLQDNGTWVWASPHIMTKGDVTWLEKVNKMVADLKADKKIDYQKIGNTDTCKEHDKLVKRFKSKVELKYVTLGSEEFRREYKNKAAEAAQELKKRLAAKCLESKEFVIAVKTEKELAKEAHAKKGVKFTESALLKSKGGIKIAGFNLEDPANFLGGCE